MVDQSFIASSWLYRLFLAPYPGGEAQKRRSSQGSRRAAEPPLTGPAPLCRRANKAGAAPALRGFSRRCQFWRCLLCSVSSLPVPVRFRIMPGLPPIWTGCCLAVCLPWRSSVVDAPPALMLWPCAMRMSVGLHCASSRRSGGCMVLPPALSAMRPWLRMAMPWLRSGTAAPLALRPWCAVPRLVGCAWFCAASEPFTYKETATSGVDSTDARNQFQPMHNKTATAAHLLGGLVPMIRSTQERRRPQRVGIEYQPFSP